MVGTQLGISLLTFPASALIARGLGPHILGSWSLMQRLLNLGATFFSLSIGHAVSYRVASTSHRAARSLTVGTATRLAGLQAVAMALTLLPIYLFLFHSAALAASLILLLFAPVTMVTLVQAHALRGALDLKGFNRSRLVTATLWLASLLVLFRLKHLTLPTIAVAFVASSGAGLIWATVAIGKHGWLSLSYKRSEAMAALGYAMRSHPGLALREVNVYADQVIVGILLGTTALGYYTVAVAGSSLLTVAATGFMYLAQPTIQSTAAADRAHVIRRILIANLAVMAPVALGAALLLPWLIGIVYGSQFGGAASAARVLAIAAIPDSIGVTLTGVLLGLGLPSAASKAQIVGLGLTVAGLPVLLPLAGILGAAVVSLIAYSVAALVLYLYAIRAVIPVGVKVGSGV